MTANTPASTGTEAGAVSHDKTEWQSIDWDVVRKNVRRLQARIVQATSGSADGAR
jgi:N-terminal domain of reverse transcriptase